MLKKITIHNAFQSIDGPVTFDFGPTGFLIWAKLSWEKFCKGFDRFFSFIFSEESRKNAGSNSKTR